LSTSSQPGISSARAQGDEQGPPSVKLLGYSTRRLFRLALLGLVLILVAFLSALTAMRFAIHGREVEVPQLTGKSTSDAEAMRGGVQTLLQRVQFTSAANEGGQSA